jgi:hypothetical protein
MKNYNTLDELLKDYEQIAYRPAKRGDSIITTPNMMTGSNENVLSVNKVSFNHKYIYSRIVRKRVDTVS